MGNNQRGQRPQMSYGKRFWHIWGPFFINWGIGIAASMAAVMIFTGAYMAEHMSEVLASYGNSDQMAEITYKVYEVVQGYTTEIEGVSALFSLPVMLYLYRKDRKMDRTYGIRTARKQPAVKYILVVILAGTMSIALNNLILIANLSSYSESYEDVSSAFYSAPLGMQLLCLGVLAPAVEELVFRGLMYRRMREDTGFVMAMVYTSVVFGLFHGNIVQMLYGTALGLMLAYVCERYGSVLAPIIGHVTANLVSIFATALNLYRWMLSDILIVGGITVGCATVAAAVFQYMRRMSALPENTEWEKSAGAGT